MTGSHRGENRNREESVGSGAVSVENYKSWWGCFFFLITDKAGFGSGYIFAVWFGTNGKFFW